MTEGMWIAVIGALATIIAAIIAAWSSARKRSRSIKRSGWSDDSAMDGGGGKDSTDLDEDDSKVEQQPSGRREETMKILFRHGIIKAGTEIEPVLQALPADMGEKSPELFRVRIMNPPRREVMWAVDKDTYSLSRLSEKLSVEYGLQWYRPHTFELWRLIGDDESLWEKAERLLEQEAPAR